MNAAEICKQCTGFCCHRFHIPGFPSKDGKPDWDKYAIIYPDDIKVLRRILIRTKTPQEWDESDGFTFTCRWYGRYTGTCRHHDKRPEICRRYVCEAAEQGTVPTANWFPAQKRLRERAGLAPTIRR